MILSPVDKCRHLAYTVRTMRQLTYRIIIEPDERNTFHGFVLTLPGCHTWGESIEETRENIRDAISAYVRALHADGEAIPEDKGLELFETVAAPQAKHAPPVYA